MTRAAQLAGAAGAAVRANPLTSPGTVGVEPAPARTLVVAAMRDELAALLEDFAGLPTQAAPAGAAEPPCEVRLGRLAGVEVAVVWTGEGALLAERGLRSVLAHVPVDRILALGVAGGLSPGLQPGDLVVGSRLVQSSRKPSTPNAQWADRALALDGVVAGTLLTDKRMLCTAAEKAAAWTGRLGSTDNATVDLETAIWASVAAEHEIPFLAVRAVCDTAREDLPFDLNDCVDPDGRVNRFKVARRALLQPSAMRALWSLRRRVRQCSGRLADFARRLLAEEER